MDKRVEALGRAHELAVNYVRGLDERPVWPHASYEQMLATFDEEMPARGGEGAADLVVPTHVRRRQRHFGRRSGRTWRRAAGDHAEAPIQGLFGQVCART